MSSKQIAVAVAWDPQIFPTDGRTKELLFLKVWNLLKRNAEPLKISSKVAWLKYILDFFDLVICATKKTMFFKAVFIGSFTAEFSGIHMISPNIS